MQHTIRLELYPWRSATKHKARPRTFHPHDKWFTNKVRLLQICWWKIVYTGSDSQAPNLREAADAAYQWTIQNDMKINKSKTKELIIDLSKTRTNFPTIRINGSDTQRVTSNLTWNVHVDEITRKAGKRLFLLLQLKRSGIPVEDLLTVYTMVVRPTLEYAFQAWSTSHTLRSKVIWSEYKDVLWTSYTRTLPISKH